MRTDKDLAIKLRLSGKSYSEISKELSVPKSTLSSWLGGLKMSEALETEIRQRGKLRSMTALNEFVKERTRQAFESNESIIGRSKLEIKNITKRELTLIGAALYWAEGYKRPLKRNGRILPNHPISMTNSDPAMVKLFIKFLRQICRIDSGKITASVRYFPHQNKLLVEKYWREATGLQESNFIKSLVTVSSASRGKRPIYQLPNGIIQIRASDTKNFHQIMGWIEGIKESV